jgi:hypothetical protein
MPFSGLPTIAELEERRRDKRTRADLVRLQADFDALQQVHGWRRASSPEYFSNVSR